MYYLTKRVRFGLLFSLALLQGIGNKFVLSKLCLQQRTKVLKNNFVMECVLSITLTSFRRVNLDSNTIRMILITFKAHSWWPYCRNERQCRCCCHTLLFRGHDGNGNGNGARRNDNSVDNSDDNSNNYQKTCTQKYQMLS